MRAMLMFVGLLVILGGLLPLLVKLIPSLNFIPTEGTVYQAIIVTIGVIAVLYGMKTTRSRSMI